MANPNRGGGTPNPESTGPETRTNFIEDIVEDDLRTGKWSGNVITRFPPEPNGYLHIGHAKSICLNFGLPLKYKDRATEAHCNLRMDDTNPAKEETEYVESIKEDVRWLGFDWGVHLYWASDYFGLMYDYAVELIKKGKAYVCDLNAEQIRQHRGTLTRPGKESPYRNRGVDENLDLFDRMRKGEFPDGSRTLRAKIDMASPNLNLRDPVMYRVLHATHHNTGDAWCIYPMYDWAHGFEDSKESVTHSICTLEFENHRPLYDWFIDAVNEGRTDDGSGPWGKKIHHPQQIEFARLELTYTVMSKRKLLELVKEKHVSGWDDPRMPTISGLRRRGVPPEAIREFARRIGVAKFNSTIDVAVLENAIRDDLNKRAPRVLGVLRPLKVIIDNYLEGQVEELDAINNPEDPSAGTRKLPFSRTLWIEQDDFREMPPPKYHRLYPGNEVRLRYAYFVKCTHVVKDAAGSVTEIHCTYDPATRGGDSPDGRKVKGTIHWVSADRALDAEVRLYDHLFTKPDPSDVNDVLDEREDLENSDQRSAISDQGTGARDQGLGVRGEGLGGRGQGSAVRGQGSGKAAAAPHQPEALARVGSESVAPAPGSSNQPEALARDWKSNLNPGSLEILADAKVEPSLAGAEPGTRYQFERTGYFSVDPDSKPGKLVFNRTVTLKDSWAKIEQKGR